MGQRDFKACEMSEFKWPPVSGTDGPKSEGFSPCEGNRLDIPDDEKLFGSIFSIKQNARQIPNLKIIALKYCCAFAFKQMNKGGTVNVFDTYFRLHYRKKNIF